MSDIPIPILGGIDGAPDLIQAPLLEFEIAERNLECWQNWQIRKMLDLPALDAYSPLLRESIDRRFAKKRDLARRWLFKRRCEVRKKGFVIDGRYRRVPALLRRPG